MISTLLNIAEAGLSIWSSKERTKYIDKLISLKREYYAELNKPDHEIDDAKLSDISFNIRLLCNAAASEIKISNPKT